MLQRFEALDGLRGICALCVLFFHVRLLGAVSEVEFFRNAYVFVDFFFILSGFVLAHGYAFKENVHFTPFLQSRFRRIYPLHFFMFMVYFCFELGRFCFYEYLNVPTFAKAFAGSGALSEVLPNILLLQAWFTAFRADSFNGVSWSISLEFYMYIFFILTVIWARAHSWVLWLCILALALYGRLFGVPFLTHAAFHGLFCFFLGSLIYVLRRKFFDFQGNFTVFSCIELLCCALILLCVSLTQIVNTILLPCLFACTVFVFSFEAGLVGCSLRMKFFQYVGMLSYSIYMVHSAILFCLKAFCLAVQKVTGLSLIHYEGKTLFLDLGNAFVNNLVLLFVALATIYVSKYTFTLVELRYIKLKAVR